jgi:nesprin-1
VINRCEAIVDDHKAYDEKLLNADLWLTPLERHLTNLKTEEMIGSPEAKTSKLQLLLSEREQADHRLTALGAAGDRILPDTSAQGREIIRQQIRRIRDRWDNLAEGIAEQQKKQGIQSLQWSSYQETLQQILTWLDNMERNVKHEASTIPSSLQEVRSKLLKCKVIRLYYILYEIYYIFYNM